MNISNGLLSVRSLGFVVMCFFGISLAALTAEAAGSVTVTRGDPMPYIHWKVDGAASCQGGFSGTPYPNNGDSIFSSWNGSTRSSLGSTNLGGPKVLGNASAAFPQSYVFRCADLGSGVADTATLVINGCPAGQNWNTTTNSCDANPPTITSFTNNGPIAYNTSATLTYVVNGATSCNINNGIGGVNASGGSVSTPNLTANTLYTLTCSNGNGSTQATTQVNVNPLAAPVVTATGDTTYGAPSNTSAPAFYSEYHGLYGSSVTTLTWTATNGATSCTVYRNGAPVASYPYPGTTQHNLSAAESLTAANTQYRVDCANGTNGIGNTVTFTVPPAQTNPGHTCSADGTSVTTTWIMPAGYNENYVRLQDSVTTVVTYVNNGTGNSYTFTGLTPGRSYNWWAHTRVPGGSYSASIGETFTCNSNSVPTVNAGADVSITLPTNSATPNGATASDSDGIASTVWTFVSGPGAPFIANANTLTPTFSLPTQGTYTFRLTATDTLGGSNSDTMNVIVNGLVVNGACGTAERNYTSTETSYSGTFCTAGTANPATPSFPAPSGSANWQCVGVGGGTTDTCTATRGGGNISVATCEIPASGSSCSATVSWSSSNLSSPSVKQNSSQFSTQPSSGGTSRTVTYGNTIFSLHDGATLVDAETVNIKCVTNYAWAIGMCVSAEFPPTLTVSKSTVRVNDTVTVSWDTNNGNEAACTLSGGGLNYSSLPPGGTEVVGSENETGSLSPVTITGRTVFTLTCPGGTVVKTVDIIPEGWET